MRDLRTTAGVTYIHDAGGSNFNRRFFPMKSYLSMVTPYFDKLAMRVRLGDPLPLFWDVGLRGLTPVTRVSMARRLRQKPVTVDAHVVSFGNITSGGTGKTPAVIERVQAELAQGKRVAVITRGYGSERVPEPFVVSPTLDLATVARQVGDEPALIRHHAPECILIKAAKRVVGAQLAVAEFGCDVIILDDAYQHVALARDENHCLIDASNPFASGHLLPRGILREPLEALHRATHIHLTRCDQAQDLEALRARIAAVVPHLPLRESYHAPGRFWNVGSGELVAPSVLEDIQTLGVTAVSAIGNPEAFSRTLESMGIRVNMAWCCRDHAQIDREALERPGYIVTTEKDAMRIMDPPDNLIALEIVLKDWND